MGRSNRFWRLITDHPESALRLALRALSSKPPPLRTPCRSGAPARTLPRLYSSEISRKCYHDPRIQTVAAARMIDFRKISKEVYAFAAQSDSLAQRVQEALAVIDDALVSFGCVGNLSYWFVGSDVAGRPEHISLSFNGGKDCTSSFSAMQRG